MSPIELRGQKRIRERKLNLGKLRDVIIYPFYECNLSCRGCPVKQPASGAGFLKAPVDAFEYHIDAEHLARINNWNVKVVTILGGEPFLSKALPDMLNILRMGEAKINVYTNATLLANTPMEELKPVLELIDYLTVSIEGDAFWTERIRGKVFSKCMAVLDKVREYTKPVARSSFWYEFACPVCGSSVRVGSDRAICYKCNRVFSIEEAKYQLRDLLRVIEILNSAGIPVETSPRLYKPPLPKGVARWFYTALSSMEMVDCLLPSYKHFLGIKYTCPAGWNRLVINPRGEITGCQWGNDSFARVEWRDEKIEEAANAWVERRRISPACYGCKHVETCRSSCKAAHDYLECPVREYDLSEKTQYVDFGGSEHRAVNRMIAIKNLKRMRAFSPGVC